MVVEPASMVPPSSSSSSRLHRTTCSKPMEPFETGFKAEPVGGTVYDGSMCSVRGRFISVYQQEPQAPKQSACLPLILVFPS